MVVVDRCWDDKPQKLHIFNIWAKTKHECPTQQWKNFWMMKVNRHTQTNIPIFFTLMKYLHETAIATLKQAIITNIVLMWCKFVCFWGFPHVISWVQEVLTNRIYFSSHYISNNWKLSEMVFKIDWITLHCAVLNTCSLVSWSPLTY